jgi:hypothetical protein
MASLRILHWSPIIYRKSVNCNIHRRYSCFAWKDEIMPDGKIRIDLFARIQAGFATGFMVTLIFHQLTHPIFRYASLAPFAPFPMAATRPFGLPAVFSLSLWGGIGGYCFAFAECRFPPPAGYWVAAFLFGAVLP